MQITVFGASGKVGTLVVEQALKRGYTVVAFVHRRNPFSPTMQLMVRKGDIHNDADVIAALRGSDAVVSCLGSWGTRQRDILSCAMRAIIPVMTERGVARIVTLTGVGVQVNPTALHKQALRLLAPTPAGKVFADAETHVRMLARSGLDWTTICSPVMNNSGGPEYRLSRKAGLAAGTVSRISVATALLDQITATDYLRQAPTIHRK